MHGEDDQIVPIDDTGKKSIGGDGWMFW